MRGAAFNACRSLELEAGAARRDADQLRLEAERRVEHAERLEARAERLAAWVARWREAGESPANPLAVGEVTRCPECDGSGRFPDGWCDACERTGVQSPEDADARAERRAARLEDLRAEVRRAQLEVDRARCDAESSRLHGGCESPEERRAFEVAARELERVERRARRAGAL